MAAESEDIPAGVGESIEGSVAPNVGISPDIAALFLMRPVDANAVGEGMMSPKMADAGGGGVCVASLSAPMSVAWIVGRG